MLANDITFDDLTALMDAPSLETLSYALRHPETWPEGFVWNYNDCAKCAMGLSYSLFRWKHPRGKGPERYTSDISRRFAMPYQDSVDIFFHTRPPFEWWRPFAERSSDSVTPEMVADRIDAFVARSRA